MYQFFARTTVSTAQRISFYNLALLSHCFQIYLHNIAASSFPLNNTLWLIQKMQEDFDNFFQWSCIIYVHIHISINLQTHTCTIYHKQYYFSKHLSLLFNMYLHSRNSLTFILYIMINDVKHIRNSHRVSQLFPNCWTEHQI